MRFALAPSVPGKRVTCATLTGAEVPERVLREHCSPLSDAWDGRAYDLPRAGRDRGEAFRNVTAHLPEESLARFKAGLAAALAARNDAPAPPKTRRKRKRPG